MKKRIFAIFTALVLFSLSFAASASGDLLYDGAQLLDDEEYNNVLGLLQEVSLRVHPLQYLRWIP